MNLKEILLILLFNTKNTVLVLIFLFDPLELRLENCQDYSKTICSFKNSSWLFQTWKVWVVWLRVELESNILNVYSDRTFETFHVDFLLLHTNDGSQAFLSFLKFFTKVNIT